MLKYNSKTLHAFSKSFNSLSFDRKLASISLFLLIFLYPGHNYLQTQIINSGKVRSYSTEAPLVSVYPLSDGVSAPSVTSRAVVIQDVESKTIMLEKNIDTKLTPASITKIMTALVALDYWTDLDTVIEVKNEDRAIGQTIELEKGEKITVKNIIYGLLVHSGNDAALAVADNYPGGYSAFVAAMNKKAKELHLNNTVFKNPSGIDQYGHFTTARDLAVLASTALQNPVIAEMVELKRIIITDITGNIVHDLETTNELLGLVPGLKGLKTGWTSNAGECLVSYIDREGNRIIVVVLGSNDRFGETRILVDWAYAHHNWITTSI